MNFHEINKAFKYGDFKNLYDFISANGVVLRDHSWNEPDEKNYYHGDNRVVYYNYRGRAFKFQFLRGEIYSCGYWLVPLIIGIHGTPVTEEKNNSDIRIRDFVI